MRVSLDDALHLLLTHHKPHAAAERLNTAFREGVCDLYCNGNLSDPNYIRAALVVQVRIEASNRWHAEMVSATREAWQHPPSFYRWEVEDEQVAALLPRRKARQKPGKKPTGNWPELIRQELRRIGLKRVTELNNSGELRGQLEAFLKRKIGWYPSDPRPLNAMIRAFLRGEL